MLTRTFISAIRAAVWANSADDAKSVSAFLLHANESSSSCWINSEAEIRVSRGKGYSTADKNTRSDDTVNTIPIDSIYNPIVNVAWDVQTLPASTEGHEKLILEIESDGSTSAKDALNHAAKIMAQHLGFFLFDDSTNIRAVNDEELNEALEIKSILSKSIDEMELSVRSHNCLQAAGIYQIAELVSKDEGEMLKYKNFGRKSLTELIEKLNELGLRFGMDIKELMNVE